MDAPIKQVTDPSDAAERAEDRRLMLHMPVDVRSVSLAVLAVSATVVILDWAAEVFIPLLLGLLFSYALTPLVDRLQSWRVPRALSAATLLIAIIGSAGGAIYALQDDAAVLIASLPDTAQKLRQVLRPPGGKPTGAIANVQKAAAELERAAADGSASTRTTRGVTRVQIEQPQFNIKDYVWSGTIGLVSFAGQLLALRRAQSVTVVGQRRTVPQRGVAGGKVQRSAS